MAAKLRGHKQRKLNDHVYSFLLFVFSRPHYQAEFNTSKVAFKDNPFTPFSGRLGKIFAAIFSFFHRNSFSLSSPLAFITKVSFNTELLFNRSVLMKINLNYDLTRVLCSVKQSG